MESGILTKIELIVTVAAGMRTEQCLSACRDKTGLRDTCKYNSSSFRDEQRLWKIQICLPAADGHENLVSILLSAEIYRVLNLLHNDMTTSR